MTLTFRNVCVPGSSAGCCLNVVVDGETVVAMLPAGQPLATTTTVVDADGCCLVAGLMDGHVHFPDVTDPVADLVAIEYLAHGITHVFCMHGTGTAVGLRERIRTGQRLGPRITTTGPMQDDPGMTREQGLAVAREHAASGYDAIKVYSQLSGPGFDGIMDAAEEAGVPVVGHVVRSVGLGQTMRRPLRHIAHLEEFVYSFLDVSVGDLAEGCSVELNPRALDELAAELVERDISVGTTIEAIRSAYEQVRDADQWFARAELACLPTQILSAWLAPGNAYAQRFDRSLAPALARIADLVSILAKEFHRRGVRLVAGTDALHTGVPHASSLYRELRDLVDAGLPHADAFRSCLTSPLEPAPEQPGAIEVGYFGDLVLLGDDPYTDVSAVLDVRAIHVSGRYVASRELRRACAALRAEALLPIRGGSTYGGCAGAAPGRACIHRRLRATRVVEPL